MAPLRQADSIERTAQVCPPIHSTRSGNSLALSHQRVAIKRRGRRGLSRPPAGGAGRRASASLDGRRLVRQRLARPNGAARPNRAASLAHCADMLSAKENPNSCKVRPCQKSCDKSLPCHTIDRSAPWSFYPAIKRSMSRASPALRNSLTSCDQAKSQARPLSRVYERVCCSHYAKFLIVASSPSTTA